MSGNDLAHHRPRLRRRFSPTEAGIVGPQLGSLVGEHQAEDTGQQSKLDHRSARGILVAATDQAGWPTGLPVVGKAAHGVAVQVL